MKDKGCICLVTCDGTDFKIDEPTPFSSKWYSQKFKHAGLRYEVCICIQTGWIVWINGPYPPGFWPDLSISRDGLNQALDRGEKFLADGGYADSHGWSFTPTGYNTREEYMKAVLRARHETVNSKFKVFGAMKQQFRHHRSKHGACFGAIANIVQARLMLEKGNTWNPHYDDRFLQH